jgi:hypothetical protein
MPLNHPPDALRSALAAYFHDLGISPVESREAYLGRLEALLGPERYDRLNVLLDSFREGASDRRELYELFETLEEARAFTRYDAEIAAEAGSRLYAAMLPHLRPGARVADLGAFTGDYLRWLAQKHPECEFVGFDRESNAVRIAESAGNPPNVQFHQWDYSCEELQLGPLFDVLFTLFGVDFTLGDAAACSLDVRQLEQCPCYEEAAELLQPCFQRWRSAAHPNARLLAILRLSSLEHALAVFHAAHQADWQLALEESCWFEADDQRFSLLAFHAGSENSTDRDRFIQWYCHHGQAEIPLAEGVWNDPVAVAIYLAATDRVAADARDFVYPEGDTVRVEIGSIGQAGYVFHRATTGFTQLQLVPLSRMQHLRLADVQLAELPLEL